MRVSEGELAQKRLRLQQARLEGQQRAMAIQALRERQPPAVQQQNGNQMGQQMALHSKHQVNQPMKHARTNTTGTATAPLVGLSMDTHDNIPIEELNHMSLVDGPASSQSELGYFQSARRDTITSTINPFVTSHSCTPVSLGHDLGDALSAGQVDVARHLLEAGAPIDRVAPYHIIFAPADRQIPLFELLLQYGWTPNTPGYYGAVLLPSIVENDALLDWFLAHGADPNLGEQTVSREGGSDTNSCQALEVAALKGCLSAVQKLLKAGAKVRNGSSLYLAASRCPPGLNGPGMTATQSKSFDKAQIPIMALLVKNGADVNQEFQTRYMSAKYPIVQAVMAGAVERVRWLLAHGADPHLKGAYGSAREYAKRYGSSEMKALLLVQDEVATCSF